MTATESIIFKKHQVHYHIFGHGPNVMLAFHGFGQEGDDLKPLAASFQEYTIYSFDLFYHGKSYWEAMEEALTKDFWSAFLEEFLRTKKIDHFSICGFSMGGKFVLATLEAHPEKIEKIILLAPDGIKTSMWYNLATYPLVFKNYFRSMIVKPHRFFNLLNFIKKVGLVERGILKFAASQMHTTRKRRRVYYSWMVFKELTFNMERIAALINDHEIELEMYLGKYDKIITPEAMNKLLRHVQDYQLEIIDSGHNQLVEKTASYLASKK